MKLRLFFFGLLLISLYFGVTYFIDFLNEKHDIGAQLSTGFFVLIALAVTLQITAHYVRAAKSKYLLDNIRESSSITLFKGLAVGNLFNSLLPLRLGEFIRAFYTGDALSVSKTTVFMAIIFERVIDGFILGACFFISGLLIKGSSESAHGLMTQIGIGIVVVSVVLLITLLFLGSENKLLLRTIHSFSGIFNDRISSRIRLMAWSGIYGIKLMLSDKRRLRKYYFASIAMWIIYFGSIASIALAFFKALQFDELWYVIQSCFAGVGTPIGPGYIGTFFSIVTSQVEKIGIVSAGGFAVLTWVILVAPISLIGLYVLARQKVGEKKEAPKQETLINKLYRENDISSEFRHFLDAYFKGERINKILTEAELNDAFRLIKSFKGGSNAHTMLVWQNNEMRVKKITLKQYADKLEAQANWLIDYKDLSNLPKVVEQEKTDHYYSFDLAYHEDYFPFFEYIHSHTSAENSAVLKKVLSFMNKNIYRPTEGEDKRNNLDKYIKSKILGKVTDTVNINGDISHIVAHKKLSVNGKSYDNMLQIIEKIKKNEAAMQDLASYSQSPIHGDLTIDNLIVSGEGDFMIIDPNNENQVSSAVVDYGKLYQSLNSGYEFLIQLERCEIKNNSISFEESKSQKYEALFNFLDKELHKSLSNTDYKSILFHEGVHYCRMLTYRATINPETVAVFYATAVKLFNEFLKQYE